MLTLTNGDIIKNRFKYGIVQLEHSILHDPISLHILLKHQFLTPYLCVKYLIFGGIDGSYGKCEKDKWITTFDVLQYQYHIKIEDIYNIFDKLE